MYVYASIAGKRALDGMPPRPKCTKACFGPFLSLEVCGRRRPKTFPDNICVTDLCSPRQPALTFCCCVTFNLSVRCIVFLLRPRPCGRVSPGKTPQPQDPNTSRCDLAWTQRTHMAFLSRPLAIDICPSASRPSRNQRGAFSTFLGAPSQKWSITDRLPTWPNPKAPRNRPCCVRVRVVCG